MAAKKINLMVGFVPIATRFEVAVEKEDAGTHAVCTGTEAKPHDPARVRASIGCTECEESHSSVYGFAQRGVERDGKLVILTAEEITGAKGEPRTGRPGKPPIMLAFHPREKVYAATVASDSVQNVYPDKGAEKAYALLRDTLRSHPEVVACMIWAPSTTNALWVLEVVDHRIVASKRCWPQQVRATVEIPPAEVADQERAMFDMLVEQTVEDFDLLTYVDESTRSLDELIASRTGVALPDTVVPSSGGQISDLIAGLQASIDALKVTKQPAKKAPAKKVAAAKAPAKKATAPGKRVAAKTTAPLSKVG